VWKARGMRGPSSKDPESALSTKVEEDKEYQMRLRSRKAPIIEIREPKEEIVFQ